MHGFPVVNAVCNSTGYTHLKVYCDQTSSDIKTQFVTKSLSTLRVWRHLKLSTCGRHWLERCSRSLKWRTLLTWKRRSMCCSSNKTIQWHWFNGGFVRIMVKKNIRRNLFAGGTNLKLISFVLRKRIGADDQVTRMRNMFVCRFSVVLRNPHGGQAGNLVTVFLAVQISFASGVKAQCSTMLDRLFYQYPEPPRRAQFVFGHNCFQCRGHLSLIREGEPPQSNHLGIMESASSCGTCVRQSDGECFLCCKRNGRYTNHSLSPRLQSRFTSISICWSTSLFHSWLYSSFSGV
jgi:hypothetical protein